MAVVWCISARAVIPAGFLEVPLRKQTQRQMGLPDYLATEWEERKRERLQAEDTCVLRFRLKPYLVVYPCLVCLINPTAPRNGEKEKRKVIRRKLLLIRRPPEAKQQP
ncbi:hypothetical protein IRJ41_003856 [Triplophysa rosa]|uniref:Uncharacterized protein n=1 Tax=Triplophysa rosa TaxID=992332 RepID=A0A9W7WD75_TRIRA|nr:hypothetical protein IRJ41_003856 [Triplophysa rosa]